MTKQKKRKIASQRDLWEVAGGLEAVVSEFSLVNLHGATYSSGAVFTKDFRAKSRS